MPSTEILLSLFYFRIYFVIYLDPKVWSILFKIKHFQWFIVVAIFEAGVSVVFCETQWRHWVKTRLYKDPPPYFIVLASSVKTK